MTAITISTQTSTAIERCLIQGDLSQLSERDRLEYYRAVCHSLGLNPWTQPFAYIRLQGKLTLYARRECTEQLRRIHGVSVQIVSREILESDNIYIVVARGTLPDGRCDESTGAIYLGESNGEIRANLLMKTESKAKRRVTLSICGLAFLDETEIESIPSAKPEPEPEIWRTWRTPEDAVSWASLVLPDVPIEELRQEFDQMPARNGKKAPVWYEKIQQFADKF